MIENILLKSCFIPSLLNSRRNKLIFKLNLSNWKNKITKKIKIFFSNKTKSEKAFYKIYRITGVYKDPQLKIHPYLIDLFSDSLMFEVYRMPMVTPPLPWYSPIKGI